MYLSERFLSCLSVKWQLTSQTQYTNKSTTQNKKCSTILLPKTDWKNSIKPQHTAYPQTLGCEILTFISDSTEIVEEASQHLQNF